jgi:hypothetical protein
MLPHCLLSIKSTSRLSNLNSKSQLNAVLSLEVVRSAESRIMKFPLIQYPFLVLLISSTSLELTGRNQHKRHIIRKKLKLLTIKSFSSSTKLRVCIALARNSNVWDWASGKHQNRLVKFFAVRVYVIFSRHGNHKILDSTKFKTQHSTCSRGRYLQPRGAK